MDDLRKAIQESDWQSTQDAATGHFASGDFIDYLRSRSVFDTLPLAPLFAKDRNQPKPCQRMGRGARKNAKKRQAMLMDEISGSITIGPSDGPAVDYWR